jgi:Xaa-Pro aminopeptidase
LRSRQIRLFDGIEEVECGADVMNISEVQEQLKRMNIDGWLLYDFQGLNPIAKKLLKLQGRLLTRRWFCWVPQKGNPIVLCHRIEQGAFRSLEMQIREFKSWNEMHEGLQSMLETTRIVAMEYSPQCSIPYVSRVDAGTVELIRSLGKEVVSSANLVQFFEARWSEEQFQMHQEASRLLMQILFDSFKQVGQAVRTGDPISEFGLQQMILEKYRDRGLFSFSPPIVAVNANSGNPHYEPHQDKTITIRRGDLLLVDLWAKLDRPGAVYADYTWMAYLGEPVPARYLTIWEIVRKSRDAAVHFVRENYTKAVEIQGWQVDLVARREITAAGYGENFVHRTGHSIGEEDHGNGANMDSLETKDERLLIPHTCFSIEPGVYLPDFGIRSEVNVYLGDGQIVVTGEPTQTEILKI